METELCVDYLCPPPRRHLSDAVPDQHGAIRQVMLRSAIIWRLPENSLTLCSLLYIVVEIKKIYVAHYISPKGHDS